jgi:hypothetical protein
MDYRVALAASVPGDRAKVYEVLRSTEGQRAFWTTDCELDEHHGRFGFAQAPVDLNVAVTLVPDHIVRMRVESGFPGWNGSTWEWALSANPDAANETIVQFRHFDFEPGHDESAVAFTAQSWAMILDHLSRYLASGVPNPFFANDAS